MDLEQQLTAALEQRASGVPVGAPDLEGVRGRARSIRRRRVAGGAAAGVAVVALVAPVAWGLGGLRGAHDAPPVTQPPAPTSTPSTVPSGTPIGTPTGAPTGSATGTGVTCSASGVPKPAEPIGLPAPVLATWRHIVDAAAACDFDALERIGTETSTTFGEHRGIENLRRWEQQGKGELGLLLKVLATTPGTGDKADDVQFYGWPAIAVRNPWRDPSAAERAELRTFATAREISSYAAGDMYYGWRVGIRDDGTWSWFTQGD